MVRTNAATKDHIFLLNLQIFFTPLIIQSLKCQKNCEECFFWPKSKKMYTYLTGTKTLLSWISLQSPTVEVRDLMDEYLKRLRINLGKPQLQLAETRQIETDLSVQLTRLKVQSSQNLSSLFFERSFFLQWPEYFKTEVKLKFWILFSTF